MYAYDMYGHRSRPVTEVDAELGSQDPENKKAEKTTAHMSEGFPK